MEFLNPEFMAAQSIHQHAIEKLIREGGVFVSDIVIERSDEHPTSLGLSKLCLFGIKDEGTGGMCVPLRKLSSRVWAMDDMIQLAPGWDGVGCVLRCEDGSALGIAYLECAGAQLQVAQGPGFVRTQKVRMYRERTQLTVTWDALGFPPEPILRKLYDASLTVTDRPDFQLLGRLNALLAARLRRARDAGYVGEVVSAFQKIVDASSDTTPCLNVLLNNLASALIQLFKYTRDVSHLDKATIALLKGLSLIPDGHPVSAHLHSNLGTAYLRKAQTTNDHRPLEEAIPALQTAVRVIRDHDRDHTDLPGCLRKLCEALILRFTLQQNPLDVSQAISIAKREVTTTSEYDDNLPSKLTTLTSALIACDGHIGDIPGFTDAIATARKAANLIPEHHPSLPGVFSDLGSALTYLFQHSGNSGDIDDALAHHRKAVRFTPENNADLPEIISNLGCAFHDRFARSGEVSDIDNAICSHRRVLGLVPEGDSIHPQALGNLGSSFLARFATSNDVRDVLEGIAALQKAVSLNPAATCLPFLLSSLGRAYAYQFQFNQEMADIDRAISNNQKSIELTPPGHHTLPGRLSTLGHTYLVHFRATGARSSIDAAVETQQRAISLVPDEHPDLPFHFSQLGKSLTYRFESMGDQHGVGPAIMALCKAVEFTPEGDASLPGRLESLGAAQLKPISDEVRRHLKAELNIYDEQFEARGPQIVWQDLEEGTSRDREEPFPSSSAWKNSGDHPRAISGTEQFFFAMEEAAKSLRRAVKLTPEGHQALPNRLLLLSTVGLYDFSISRDQGPLQEALHNLELAALCVSGALWERLTAAVTWTNALALASHPPPSSLILAFDTTIHLITMVAGLELTVQGRYTKLQRVSHLPLEGATIAYTLGRLDKAIEWLEQGRCLVWRQLHDLRAPLDTLRTHDEKLAERVLNVAKQLEHAGSSRRQENFNMPLWERMSLEAETRNHLLLSKQWDDLLTEVRHIPDFEDFLKPTPCSKILRLLPTSGPIVVINIRRKRGDAIALLSGSKEPLHIPLPLLTVRKIKEYRSLMDSQLRMRGLRVRGNGLDPAIDADESDRAARKYRTTGVGKTGGVVQGVLEGLWNEVARPILHALGFLERDDSCAGRLPRIWWCPTGPLSFLPIHAAGIHSGVYRECVQDYVVSSYTPSVTALQDRITLVDPTGEKASGLLLTSQPDGLPSSPILGTEMEVESIYSAALDHGVRVEKLNGADLQVDEFLAQMDKFSSVHIACHASQNAADPLQSQFHFNNGSLDLKTIMRKNLKNADLAFLSACQTSTGEGTLPDEAVHLAAGMLAAGYRRVVATMWSIRDEFAPDVAKDFYQYLWDARKSDGGAGFDGTDSAYALHHATQKLRQRLDDMDVDPEKALLFWAPYVHFGY